MSDVRVTIQLFPTTVKGIGMLKLRIGIPGQRKYKFKTLGYKIPEVLWNAEAEQVKKGFPNYQYINADISRKKGEVEQGLLGEAIKGKKITENTIKRQLITPNGDFIQFFADYIEKLRSPRVVNGEQVKKYAETYIAKWSGHLNAVKEYAGNFLPFEDINVAWLEGYENNKGKTQERNTTLHLTMKRVMEVVRKAIKAGLIDPAAVSDYKIPPYVGPEREYLTLDELDKLGKEIYSGKLDSRPDFKALCCYFLLECCCGLRFSDWRRFKIEKLIDGEAIKVRAKKNGQPVYVPISNSPRLLKISRYITKHKIKYDETLQHANRLLKLIPSIVPIKVHFSTHIGRHTCATMLLELGYSKEAIAEQLGVSIRTVDIYAKTTRRKLRNEYDRFGGI